MSRFTVDVRELISGIELPFVMSQVVLIPTGLCHIAQGCRASRLPWEDVADLPPTPSGNTVN